MIYGSRDPSARPVSQQAPEAIFAPKFHITVDFIFCIVHYESTQGQSLVHSPRISPTTGQGGLQSLQRSRDEGYRYFQH